MGLKYYLNKPRVAIIPPDSVEALSIDLTSVFGLASILFNRPSETPAAFVGRSLIEK
jgi:hypothetical protein